MDGHSIGESLLCSEAANRMDCNAVTFMSRVVVNKWTTCYVISYFNSSTLNFQKCPRLIT